MLSAVENEVVVKKCGCGRVYTKAQWQKLQPLAGDCYSEDESHGYVLDLKNCHCGSTIAIEYRINKRAAS